MKHPIRQFGMKAAIPFVYLLIALTVQGCTTISILNLNTSPTNIFLISIHPNPKVKVAYSFSSDVPYPYYHDFFPSLREVFPVDSSFKSNLDVYMRTKFNDIVTKAADGSAYNFKFTLRSFSFIDSSEQSRPLLKVLMSTSVRVSKGDSLIGTKMIDAKSQSVGTYWNDKLDASLTNEAMNRTFIIIDKFLSSLGF